MARNKFRGDAPAVAQVSQFTVTATGAAGDTATLTISNKTVAATVPAAPTTTTVAAAIAAAAAASSVAEFKEVVWTSVGAVVYGTAKTAGMPFTLTSVTASGAGTFSGITTPTASSGPNHWDAASNWSLGIVPISTHDVDLQDTDVDILYGLAQSAVTLASFNIYSTYTGKIGLPQFNGDYYEYRETELAISATLVNIGQGDGSGSPMIRLNTGTNQTTMSVYATSTGGVQGQPAVFWRGVHASNTVTVVRGAVGLAFNLGEVATVQKLAVGSQGGSADALVYGGAVLTLDTLNQVSGTVKLANTLTTIGIDDGTLNLTGTGLAIATLNGRGGTINFDGTGTVTTTTLYKALLDLSRNPLTGKTFTNITLNAGCGLNDRNKVATFTNGIAATCKLSEVSPFEIGTNYTIVRS